MSRGSADFVGIFCAASVRVSIVSLATLAQGPSHTVLQSTGSLPVSCCFVFDIFAVNRQRLLELVQTVNCGTVMPCGGAAMPCSVL